MRDVCSSPALPATIRFATGAPFRRAATIRIALRAVLLVGAACKSPRPGYVRLARETAIAGPTADGGAIVAPKTVSVELSEWTATLSAVALEPGATTFRVHNRGTIAHQFEVEGAGMEKRTRLIAPDSTVTLSVDLVAGTYEMYCPVAGGAHKKMGMLAHATVAAK